MFLRRTIAASWLLAGAVYGEALTTIVPCSGAPHNVTVTAQHQPVSTCTRSGNSFSYSTYNYVSTVIPCWGGNTMSSCTVTKTDQPVPCSGSATTITTVVPITTGKSGSGHTNSSTSYLTKHETVSKAFVAPYNKLGPLAIPGYEGNDLCTDCGTQSDGSRKQFMNVTECHAVDGKEPVCSQWTNHWVSRSAASSATGQRTAIVSSHAVALSAGTYVYTFPQPAPTTTITSQGRPMTVPGKPWNAYVTRSCWGPTAFDFTVTVTKTITYTMPYSTESESPRRPFTGGFANHGWAAWSAPSSATTTGRLSGSASPSSASATTTTQPADPASSWGAWETTTTTSSADPAQTWGAWPVESETTTSSFTSGTSKTSSETTNYSHTTETSTYSRTREALSTTSARTTSAGGASEPRETFYIEATYTEKLQRRFTKHSDTSYVTFADGSNDSTLVKGDGAIFWFDRGGYLRTREEFVAGDSSSGYFVFEKTSVRPATPPNYRLDGDGAFIRVGGAFCATSANFFVTIGSAPGDCKLVTCKRSDGKSTSSTTTTQSNGPSSTSFVSSTTIGTTTRAITTTSTYTTTSAWTTSTSTASFDPSGDLDADLPSATPYFGPAVLDHIKRSGRYMNGKYRESVNW